MTSVASDAIVEVLNPFARARKKGVDLVAILDRDPVLGGAQLDQLVRETAEEIAALDGGLFYRLAGATAEYTTPMQYGGYFLERDRELLADAKGPRIIYVEGDREVYFDFVSDLPAEIFGYDVACGVTVEEVRALRRGPILADDPNADVRLVARSGPYLLVNKELINHP